MAFAKNFEVCRLDLSDTDSAARMVDLLDAYARDPMGGGTALLPGVRATLVERLRAVPHYHGALAWAVDAAGARHAVGCINCFGGFSTFAAQPLLNIHDLAVLPDWRGQGIGRALLDWAEGTARALGCCKLTLEVLSANAPAMRTYRGVGYQPYVLDPAAGQALLLQKYL